MYLGGFPLALGTWAVLIETLSEEFLPWPLSDSQGFLNTIPLLALWERTTISSVWIFIDHTIKNLKFSYRLPFSCSPLEVSDVDKKYFHNHTSVFTSFPPLYIQKENCVRNLYKVFHFPILLFKIKAYFSGLGLFLPILMGTLYLQIPLLLPWLS